MRRYWACRYVSLVRPAALLAASIRATRSQLSPLRVLPERRLPADSSWPGQTAAQLAACRWVGKRLDVGAQLGDDHLGRALSHPGDRAKQLDLTFERAHALLDLRRERVDRLVEILDVGEQVRDEAARDGP